MAKKKKLDNEEYDLIIDWCKKLDIKSETGIAEVKKIESSLKKDYPDMSNEDIRLDAIGSWFANKKRHLTDIASEGVILKVVVNTGAFDWVAKKRAKALQKADEDLDEAIEKGYVRVEYNDMNEVSKIIPLYYWAKNRKGEDNKKLGDDLPEHNYLWNITCVGLLKSEYDKAVTMFNSAKKMKNKNSPEYKKKISYIGRLIRKVEGNIPDRFCSKSSKNYKDIVHGEWIYTNCKIKSNDKKKKILYIEANDESDFTKIFHDELIDKVSTKSLPNMFNDQKIDLKNLNLKFKQAVKADGWKQDHSRGSNKTYMSVVFVSASDPGSDEFSASLAVSSPEMGILTADGTEVKPIKVWWKDTLPLDFGPPSKIALFYRMKQNHIKMGDNYSEEWGDVTFDAQGYIMITKRKKEVPEVEKEPEKKSKGSKKISKASFEKKSKTKRDEDLEDVEELEELEELEEEIEDLDDLEDEFENIDDDEEIDDDLDEDDVSDESDDDEFDEEDLDIIDFDDDDISEEEILE